MHHIIRQCSSAASVELTETRANATIQERITAIGGYMEIMEKGVFGLKSGGRSLGSPMLQLIAIIYGELEVKGKLQKHRWRINLQFILLKARNMLVFYIPCSINQFSWYCGYS
ncbi:hypothetical protein F2Q69_00052023 [Brassica cretica]|uniref:Uncharacterized protein n=1 Tax=Brassica cretica TaxID=69181 RepID=A0A8S9MXY4_BRACR|nr:hypothetical protein F2Q69_00052023 [Brassica cretica]